MIEVLFTPEELQTLGRGFAVIKDGVTYRALGLTEDERAPNLEEVGRNFAHTALRRVFEEDYGELAGADKDALIDELLAIAKRTDTDTSSAARILAKQFDGSRYGTLTAYADALAGNR
jgi:hypothetical protein